MSVNSFIMCAAFRFSVVLVGLVFLAVPEHGASQHMNAFVEAEAKRAKGGIGDWYRARNNAPVWNGERLGGLAQFIRGLDAHGLSPSLFQLDAWDAQWRSPSPDPKTRAAVEVGTTQLALYAIQALAYGFVDPTTVHAKWDEIPRKLTSYHFLDQALQKHPAQIASFLLQVVPPQESRYKEMVNTLARYRKIQALGGWRQLPATIQPAGPGTQYPEWDLLTSRLEAEGDLPGGAPKNKKGIIDQRTGEAIKSFQFRHGIEPDGYIGTETLTELNKDINRRVNQIIINIDRLRWMPRTWEQAEHVEVNIAESALRVFRNQKMISVMPVVVGKKGVSETPVFHGDVESIYFHPTWKVPTSIAKRLLVPAALKSGNGPHAYMVEHDYEIVKFYGSKDVLSNTVDNLNRVSAGSLLMQQRGGPKNSLGLIKFIFPNDSAVYLHDTNHRELFEKADRDFSSGCVRVQRPEELAMILLRANPGWTTQSIRAAMQNSAQPDRREVLKQTMPVYLNYWTCTVMEDGRGSSSFRVRFDKDIYGHDEVMFERFGLR